MVFSFSQAASSEKVLYNRRNPHVMEVILNHEKALNSLNLEMIQSLEKNADLWSKDSQLKAVLIRGQGQKAFCAGGDVKTLYEARTGKGEKGQNLQILDQFFREEYTCDYKMATMKPILIALWNGIVMGGGVGISIHAPFRIATEKSMFAMPEAKIGLFTDVSGGFFLSRLRHNLGLYLGLTSQRLKGKDLVKAGIANFYLPSERVPELEKRLFDNPNVNSLSKSSIDAMLRELCEHVEGNLDHDEDINK
jgi:3-hydroxyisobutyryl-CoA hydrolase